MAASLRASEQGLEIVDQARKKKGWAATAVVWYEAAQTTKATLKRFRRGIPIQQDAFIGICKAVGIENWEAIVDDSPLSQMDFKPEFSQYDDAWVGREQLVAELSEKLRLSAESCQSRLIVTSQDLPVKLVDSRYKNFWHRQALYGLDESEQEALFETTGLDVSEDSPDKPLLLRIGKAYKGHPLVLRVILGEISSEPFSGNVQAYWNDCADKIEEVEKALYC